MMACEHIKELEKIIKEGIQEQTTRKVTGVQYKGYVVKFQVTYEGIERPRTFSYPIKDRCPQCGKTISLKPNAKRKTR